MESYISFKWKSLDIISSQGKVGPFWILSKKPKQKAKWKQKSKPTTMLSGKCSFSTPLENGRNPLVFLMCPWVKKGNIGLKLVDISGREIISIRDNTKLIYGINGQNATSTSASNSNVISRVTIFISEKFKGSCE